MVVDDNELTGAAIHIALDSLGKVHICYNNFVDHNLKYASNADGQWKRTTIDDSPNSVGNPSGMALDQNDKVHICYYDFTAKDLRYINNTGGTWDRVDLVSGNDVGSYSDIAVDSNNKVHIVFYGATNQELYHITNAAGSWSNEILDSMGDVDRFCSVAMDGQDRLHAVYLQWGTFDLMYGRQTGNLWTSVRLDHLREGMYMDNSLVLDRDGRPHIVYYDPTHSDLKLAEPFAEPSAPLNLEAEVNASGVLLSWDDALWDHGYPIHEYRVYRGLSPGSMVLIDHLGATANEYLDQTAYGGTYYYRVAAVNDIGVGQRSDEAEIAVEATMFAPGAPENLDADAGNGTVTLTWDRPDDDGGSPITGYNIYRGTAEGYLVLLTTIGNVTTYTDDEVVNGQTYWYKVSAVNAVGEGAMTGMESATPTAEDKDDDGGSNTMLYIIIAIMAIAAVAVAAVFFLRKRK